MNAPTHTHKPTHSNTDTYTDSQTHTQTQTHTNTHTHVKKALCNCVVISKRANGEGKPVCTIIDLLLLERLELQQYYLWPI